MFLLFFLSLWTNSLAQLQWNQTQIQGTGWCLNSVDPNNCNAKDATFQIQITPVAGSACRFDGDTIQANVTVFIQRSQSGAGRFNLGVYVNLDGGPAASDPTARCARAILPTSATNPLTDIDVCGDLIAFTTTVIFQSVSLACKTDGAGNLVTGVCISYDNSVNGQPQPCNLTSVLPGTSSKCVCDTINYSTLSGALTVRKATVPSTSTESFSFTLRSSNTNAQFTPQTFSLSNGQSRSLVVPSLLPYTLVEAPKAGWKLDSVTCNNNNLVLSNLTATDCLFTNIEIACPANAARSVVNGNIVCTCTNGFGPNPGTGITWDAANYAWVGTCQDANECSLGTHNCATGSATCTNTPGSFTCACNAGYTGNGVTCNDVDECTLGTHNCDGNAACTNTVGSFTCACNRGFTGSGTSCTDLNECVLGTHNCDGNAACTNTVGSFTCACNRGFTGSGTSCTDLNECTLGTHNCDGNAACTNTFGSFTCACNRGFTGSGTSCTDLNECVLGTHNCDGNAACTNTIGSFTCACNRGFTGSGTSCTDINECTLGTHNCDGNAACTNTIGSFTCACNRGFTGSGVTCTDINECTTGLHNCNTNAACTNTPGSFTCACNAGFTGDGVTSCQGNNGYCGDSIIQTSNNETCDFGLTTVLNKDRDCNLECKNRTAFFGCSPGFWRSNSYAWSLIGVNPNLCFSSIFTFRCLTLTRSTAGTCVLPNGNTVSGISLNNILILPGGSFIAIARQATAAYLNSLVFGNEAFYTQAEIQALLTRACTSGAANIDQQIATFNDPCPLGVNKLTPRRYNTTCTGGCTTGTFLQVCYETKYSLPCPTPPTNGDLLISSSLGWVVRSSCSLLATCRTAAPGQIGAGSAGAGAIVVALVMFFARGVFSKFQARNEEQLV